eukprot:TRINITY_DN52134_c0_g1_i1.p1 TRINITY_DN52134_c0_g1~~TRINITY_DN52134_c0_g1_i1.p1  ORF type:complete len:251 (+),score=28.11 TRINITY_DN52134_c0_g1_i1:112-753(+)
MANLAMGALSWTDGPEVIAVTLRHFTQFFNIDSWSCGYCATDPLSPLGTTPHSRRPVVGSLSVLSMSPAMRDSLEEELCGLDTARLPETLAKQSLSVFVEAARSPACGKKNQVAERRTPKSFAIDSPYWQPDVISPGGKQRRRRRSVPASTPPLAMRVISNASTDVGTDSSSSPSSSKDGSASSRTAAEVVYFSQCELRGGKHRRVPPPLMLG